MDARRHLKSANTSGGDFIDGAFLGMGLMDVSWRKGPVGHPEPSSISQKTIITAGLAMLPSVLDVPAFIDTVPGRFVE